MRNGLERLESDEIDLLELFRQCWKDRVIILLAAALATIVAVAYALWTPSIYTPSIYRAQVVIAPGVLANFGSLAGQIQARSSQPVAVAIADSKQLAVDSFELLIAQLESKASKAEFDESHVEAPRNVTLEIKRGRAEGDPVTVIARAGQSGHPGRFLDAYLAFASARASAELNGFLTGMELHYEAASSMLYRVESPSYELSSPVHPKPLLIITLGFVLGTMAGAFIVMMRALLKRESGTPAFS
ncbi:Wzz/FepE/Etk N-terminal domain-containing protein [Stutzerimonas decontaminans]|nr:Wzz/FepE/Etk N-terminal domain-containing protein [Stutzerimonas decontaminans]